MTGPRAGAEIDNPVPQELTTGEICSVSAVHFPERTKRIMTHAAATDHLSPRRAALRGALLTALFALGACSAGSVATPPASNAFFAQLSQSGLTGRYDPTGFEAHQVRKILGQVCANRGNLINYVEQPVDGGMAFSARCKGGSDVRFGTISVYRFGDNARITVPGYVEKWREAEVVRTISI